MRNTLGTIVGFLLLAGIAAGLVLVVTLPFEMAKKAEAESWPSRKAVVTKSYVSRHRGGAGKFPRGPYAKPEICARYTDNGEEVCAARIRYGAIRLGEGETTARDTIARYPVGREIDVYFSPGDPKQTVLEAVSPWTEMYALLGVGIVLLLLPLVLWVSRSKIEPQRYGRT